MKNQIKYLNYLIWLHPKDYINQSNDENISNLLEKSANYSLKPNALIKSQSLYFQFREGLMNNYAKRWWNFIRRYI